MATASEIITELMFGSGGFIVLLFMVIIIAYAGLKNKFVAILCIPISILMAISYFQNVDPSNNLIWGGIIMLILPIFLTIRLIEK